MHPGFIHDWLDLEFQQRLNVPRRLGCLFTFTAGSNDPQASITTSLGSISIKRPVHLRYVVHEHRESFRGSEPKRSRWQEVDIQSLRPVDDHHIATMPPSSPRPAVAHAKQARTGSGLPQEGGYGPAKSCHIEGSRRGALGHVGGCTGATGRAQSVGGRRQLVHECLGIDLGEINNRGRDGTRGPFAMWLQKWQASDVAGGIFIHCWPLRRNRFLLGRYCRRSARGAMTRSSKHLSPALRRPVASQMESRCCSPSRSTLVYIFVLSKVSAAISPPISPHHCRILALDRKLDAETRGDRFHGRSLTPRQNDQQNILSSNLAGERFNLYA